MAVLFAAPAVVISLASASPVQQFVEIRTLDAPELFLRKAEFETALKEAKRIICAFASGNALPRPRGLGAARLTVYPSQEVLWRELFRTPPGKEPPPPPRRTLVAVGGGYRIDAVTPEEFARVIPEYAALRPDAWIRLIAHELAHSWQEELGALGPRWFFEAFAIIAADQGFGEELKLDTVEAALAPIDWEDRFAYANAAARLRYFLRWVGIDEMISRASSPDFESWLRSVPSRRQERQTIRSGETLLKSDAATAEDCSPF